MYRLFISGLFLALFTFHSGGTQWNMRDSRNMVADGTGLPIEINDSNTLWKVRLGSHQYTIPVISNGRIFLGLNDDGLQRDSRFRATKGGLVMCLDEKTGNMLWQMPMPRVKLKGHFFNHVNCGVCSTPVIDGDRMFWQSPLVGRSLCTVAISKGLLYVADYNSNMHCFDAWTGERYWVHDIEGGAWTASPLAADGKVYICTEKNRFFVFKEGKEKVLLNKQVLPSTAITPVIVNGVFYLPLQNALLAVRTESQNN